MGNKVVVIAAHPDDEVLGCGGTMAKHSYNGDEVHVLILAEGITSRSLKRDRRDSSEELSALAAAAEEAKNTLGCASLTMGAFPDNRMDSIPLLEVIKPIEAHLQKIQPQIVYTHHPGDLNIDHQVINKAVVTACRPLPGQCIEKLLFFEVSSSTEWQAPNSLTAFTPNWFENISAQAKENLSFLDLKKEALKAYACEMRPWPHSRSIEAVEYLARWRGSNVGVNAAEAFILGRKLSK